MSRSVVLLGLPGAGKTTVGKLVAKELGAPFIDTDAVIVRRMQKPVAQVFAEDGEPRFRQLEAETVRNALDGPAAVIAPGGGWAVQPGALDAALEQALFVYLKVMVTTAANRTGSGSGRPLLDGHDPVTRMRELLEAREPYYSRAHVVLKADGKSAAELAREIVALARERAGWGS